MIDGDCDSIRIAYHELSGPRPDTLKSLIIILLNATLQLLFQVCTEYIATSVYAIPVMTAVVEACVAE